MSAPISSTMYLKIGSHQMGAKMSFSLSKLLSAIILTACLCNQQQFIKSVETKSLDREGNPDRSQEQYPNIESTIAGLNQNDPIRTIHYHFEQKMDPFLQLHKFNFSDDKDSSNKAICNDGSPSGYYKRLNSHSKSWIIYLQGGGFCGSEEACRQRWLRSPHLMSSNYWSKLKSVDGILSSEPKHNPYLWNANHIYVPYCSSDSWTGLQEARTNRYYFGPSSSPSSASPTATPSSFAFMGSRIIERVIESLFDDLPRESSLYESKFILFAGDSAGATGAILNLDKVNRLVQQRINSSLGSSEASCFHDPSTCRQAPVLRGLADSGWFLDNEPYDSNGSANQAPEQVSANNYGLGPGMPEQTAVDCNRQRCTLLQSIKQAMLYWNGQVPAACASRQPNEPWRCYFAYRTYPTLKTPLFVVQWLYDEAQLMVDNIIRPGTIGEWNYVNKLVSETRASLENVTALFAPSCFAHSLIVKQSWNQININGLKLPHILKSWEEEILVNQPSLEGLNQDLELSLATLQHMSLSDQQAALISRDSPMLERFQQFPSTIGLRTSSSQQQRSINGNGNANQVTTNPGFRSKSRKKKRNNNNGSLTNGSGGSSASTNTRFNPTSTNRLSRSAAVDDATLVYSNNVPELLVLSTGRHQDGTDKFRLIDSCGWPQCNRDCPYSEQETNFRPILAYR